MTADSEASARTSASTSGRTSSGETSTESRAGRTASDGRGRTQIADHVISVIARYAAEEVDGVHRLGESNLRSMLPRRGRHWGVESEVGLKEAAVDIEVIVEFGYPIWQVADTMRQQVIESIEEMTGRHVLEVNISIVDVHVPRLEQKPQQRRVE